MRDRTTRTVPFGPPWPAMAARQGVALDPLDDLDDVEQQAAGGSVGLDQLDPQAIAQAIGISRALADQQLAALVVAEGFRREAPGPDQPGGSRTVGPAQPAK